MWGRMTLRQWATVYQVVYEAEKRDKRWKAVFHCRGKRHVSPLEYGRFLRPTMAEALRPLIKEAKPLSALGANFELWLSRQVVGKPIDYYRRKWNRHAVPLRWLVDTFGYEATEALLWSTRI